NAYFASLLVLGDAFLDQFTGRTAPAVRVIFDVTSGAGQDVAYGLAAVVVPEPSTGLLLGLGLVWVAIRRDRSGTRA
ncbi:MAG TPA: PEP-CTERM sorting domain-containing protein, partial [Deltaproteobacteria bacterium]|nr:PEP-CTERM sorting domain-containing protein [Deltaproteobacteria bacterium]